jgi:hypothetical protein
MPIGIARMKFVHVGATPRVDVVDQHLRARRRGKSRSAPAASWVQEVDDGQRTLMPVDSLTPTMLIAPSTARSISPRRSMSPGRGAASQNWPPR